MKKILVRVSCISSFNVLFLLTPLLPAAAARFSPSPGDTLITETTSENRFSRDTVSGEIFVNSDSTITVDAKATKNFKFPFPTYNIDVNANLSCEVDSISGNTVCTGLDTIPTFDEVFVSTEVDSSGNTEIKVVNKKKDGKPGKVISETKGKTRQVPEPLTILCSITALGVGSVIKKEHSKRLKKAKSKVA